MNMDMTGPRRPKLHWPKALLSDRERSAAPPTLSVTELRRIVAEVIG